MPTGSPLTAVQKIAMPQSPLPKIPARFHSYFAARHWHALLKLQIAFLQGHARSDNMLVGRYKQWLGMLTQGYEEASELWQTVKKQKQLETIVGMLQAQSQAGDCS